MKVALIGTVASSVVGFRRELITSMLESGHEVHTFAIDFDDVTRSEVVGLGAVPIDYSLNRAGINPFRDVLDTIKLAVKLRRSGFDMCLCYFVKPVIYGTLAAALAGIRVRIGMLEGLGFIFTDQPTGITRKTKALRRVQVFLYRISFPLLNNLIFLNHDDPKDLLDRFNIKVRRFSVLGGIGLNLKNYCYIEPPIECVSFIFIGRLLAEKGVHEYLKAAVLVKRAHPETKFYLLGELDEANPGSLSRIELDHMIKSDVVIHPGHVSNVQDWLAAASVFVLPSYREGMPRSTQEAMAMGRPVITSDAPGCRETVVEGVNGFVVPRWDPIALASKMIYFIEHPDSVVLMGQQSYKIACEKFDSERVNRRLLELMGL